MKCSKTRTEVVLVLYLAARFNPPGDRQCSRGSVAR